MFLIKNNKIKLLLALVVITIIAASSFTVYLNSSLTIDKVESVVNSRFTVTEDIKDCQFKPNYYCFPTNRRNEIVPLNTNLFNPTKPTYSVVFNENKGSLNGQDYNYVDVLIARLSKDNVSNNDWKLESFTFINTNKLGFDKVKELVKNGDIEKNNPDNVNIRIIPNFTPTQIQSSQEGDKKQDAVKQKALNFQNASSEQKVELAKEEIKLVQGYIDAYEMGERTYNGETLTPDSYQGAKEILQEYQAILVQLEQKANSGASSS